MGRRSQGEHPMERVAVWGVWALAGYLVLAGLVGLLAS